MARAEIVKTGRWMREVHIHDGAMDVLPHRWAVGDRWARWRARRVLRFYLRRQERLNDMTSIEADDFREI